MDGWRAMILLVSFLGIFVCGFFIVMRFDRFLRINRKASEEESDAKEPARVVLTDDMSDEEIAAAVRAFRADRGNARVVLCEEDDEDVD